MIPFYDNWSAQPDSDGWVDIERIYCFDWDEFDKSMFKELETVLATLPGAIKHDCYAWYSDTDDIENGYLMASVEPPGLQVYGTLPFTIWQRWDQSIQAKA